jgi:hypothetical protein
MLREAEDIAPGLERTLCYSKRNARERVAKALDLLWGTWAGRRRGMRS